MAQTQSDKRTLRSKDGGGGARFKSDLALYFPGLIEELLGEHDREPDFLLIETPIHIANDEPRAIQAPHTPSSKLPIVGGRWRTEPAEVDALHANLHNATVLNFRSFDKVIETYQDDALSDDVFDKAHRRAERQEKQLRNIEKERAQHEKHHLERLLEGLRGHDWLKVMGVTGITDTEKRDFEPKRVILIAEVAALVDKFRIWKDEEKRRKAERQAALMHSMQYDDYSMDGHISDEDPPDYSDVDASAARQLHLEAIRATSLPQYPVKRASHKKTVASQPAQDDMETPFTSFYSKLHMRAAALQGHRRSTRGMTAFGHPVPDMPEADFRLSDEWTSGSESQRRRRRLKRDSGRQDKI